tara:strand:- start:397 stop:537 length:141 start_codon:yes stop_codon:yes gene_type:complete
MKPADEKCRQSSQRTRSLVAIMMVKLNFDEEFAVTIGMRNYSSVLE